MPLDHRYFWSTHFVRERLRVQDMSEAAIFRYFLVIMVFDWLQFRALPCNVEPRNVLAHWKALGESCA